jgi:calpain-15
VRLCIQGTWLDIDIDDYFVWHPERNNWRFSSSKQNEVWVQLLEKAWAKACGSYARSIGGTTAEGLNVLTGAPTETIDHKSVDISTLWNKIFSSDQKGFVMACSVGSEDIPGEH